MNISTFLTSCAITLALFSSSFAQTVDPNAVDGQLHFKVSDNPGLNLDGYTGGNLALDALFAASGLDSIFKPFPLPGTELDSIYRIVFPNIAQVSLLQTAIEALPYVEYAEKNPLVFEFETPNDLQTNQWALDKIQAELGWNYSTGNGDVLVAVLDDAIAIDHEDLAANIYVNTAEQNGFPLLDDDLNGKADDINGFDVADGDANPRPPANASGNGDGFAHGTHVTGIISAATNNATGIASIGYNTKILPVKIGRDSDAALSGATDGIYYAMRSGADIMNLSWGTTTDAATLKSLILQASAAGMVIVAAAGNEGDQTVHYPAAYPQVISVGATDQNDARASFSNYGSTVTLMAPGVDIYSTLPEGNNTYGNQNGTSMATPLVSGLAALVKDHFPSFSAAQIQQRMEEGCEDISAQNPGMNGMIGAGRINAFRTLGNVAVLDSEIGAFNIYPNPTNRYLNFDLEEGITPNTIEVIDVTGRVTMNMTYQRSIDLSGLNDGVYSVRLRTETSSYSSKIILQ
ncbi:MAG: S8 family serine peptidase [Flavobacteriales bacterium]|nr:S8 family serine peptidase [Flavobacteriales bacterium]